MNDPVTTRAKLLLAIASGILLGAAFPPLHAGFLAAAGFVPFFILMKPMERYGPAVRYSYLVFFVFNVVTLYWTGGYVHGRDSYMMVAGALLILVHPFFFIVPVVFWMMFRRRFGFTWSLAAFPLLWTSFEYLHSLTEIAFPWLTLGNTQTYDLPAIQFASFTGVYGISFWLVVLNVLLYLVYEAFIGPDRTAWRIGSRATAFVLLFILPRIYGAVVLSQASSSPARPVRLALVQPNSDPFEKWQSSAGQELTTLEQLTREIPPRSVDLILWPETAVPFYILHPANIRYFESIKNEVDSAGIPLLTGMPDIVTYPGGAGAPKSSKVSVTGERYDSYNSSMLLEPHRPEIQKYAKIILVPFAERVPFAEALSFLHAMQWNFGLGGWGIGRDTTVFHFTTLAGDTERFSNMICYESIYPGYVAGFVRKGARFLTVITNDSWWGNTSGTYQHARIGVLRAVENRRWVAQCANGGISCFIDPWGRTVESTQMYTRTILAGSLAPASVLTFYSAHGDWFAELCLVLALFLLAGAAGKSLHHWLRRRQQSDDSGIEESALAETSG